MRSSKCIWNCVCLAAAALFALGPGCGPTAQLGLARGGGGEDVPPETGWPLGQPRIRLSPAAGPLLLRAEFEDGAAAEYFGERDPSGNPTTLTAIAVNDPVHGPACILFDPEGRATLISAADGAVRLEWQTETTAAVSRIDPGGQVTETATLQLSKEELSSAKPAHDADPGSRDQRTRSKLRDGTRFEVVLTDCRNRPLRNAEGRVTLVFQYEQFSDLEFSFDQLVPPGFEPFALHLDGIGPPAFTVEPTLEGDRYVYVLDPADVAWPLFTCEQVYGQPPLSTLCKPFGGQVLTWLCGQTGWFVPELCSLLGAAYTVLCGPRPVCELLVEPKLLVHAEFDLSSCTGAEELPRESATVDLVELEDTPTPTVLLTVNGCDSGNRHAYWATVLAPGGQLITAADSGGMIATIPDPLGTGVVFQGGPLAGPIARSWHETSERYVSVSGSPVSVVQTTQTGSVELAVNRPTTSRIDGQLTTDLTFTRALTRLRAPLPEEQAAAQQGEKLAAEAGHAQSVTLDVYEIALVRANERVLITLDIEPGALPPGSRHAVSVQPVISGLPAGGPVELCAGTAGAGLEACSGASISYTEILSYDDLLERVGGLFPMDDLSALAALLPPGTELPDAPALEQLYQCVPLSVMISCTSELGIDRLTTTQTGARIHWHVSVD